MGNIKENAKKKLSPEEVIEKSFDIVETFYSHLTAWNQPVTEKDISDMQWVLDNICTAIKEDKEKHK